MSVYQWHKVATHLRRQQCVSILAAYHGHTVCLNIQPQHPCDIPWPHIQCDNSEVMFTVAAPLWHTMVTHTMWQQWSHVHCGSILMAYHGHTYNVTTVKSYSMWQQPYDILWPHNQCDNRTVKSYSLCQHPYDILLPHIQCDNSEVIFTASILKAQGSTHLSTLFTEHYLLMHRNEWNLAKTNSCAHFNVTGK